MLVIKHSSSSCVVLWILYHSTTNARWDPFKHCPLWIRISAGGDKEGPISGLFTPENDEQNGTSKNGLFPTGSVRLNPTVDVPRFRGWLVTQDCTWRIESLNSLQELDWWSIYPSSYLSVSVSLSVYPSDCISICQTINLSVYLCINIYVQYLSIHPSIY